MIQRVTRASVAVDGTEVASIGHGFLVLVAVEHGDTAADAGALAAKLVGLRVFADEDGLMNRSVVDVAGSVLVVSQFTLAADIRRGRRPSFTGAAAPDVAAPLVDAVMHGVDAAGVPVLGGSFGAHMLVDLVNDGPVTLICDVRDGRVR